MNSNHVLTLVSFILILLSNPLPAQQILCKEITGKWEMYREDPPFGIEPRTKSAIWSWNADGTIVMNGKKGIYKIMDKCSRLEVNNDHVYTILQMTKDSLTIRLKLMPHESYTYYFKKIK